MFEFMS